MFVGSFNLDPRSASLNTEMGLVIESPALAEQIAAAFADDIPARSYRVRLNEAGRLEWLEQHENGVIVHKTEPGVTWWKRFGVAVVRVAAYRVALVGFLRDRSDDVGDGVHHELRVFELDVVARLLRDDPFAVR